MDTNERFNLLKAKLEKAKEEKNRAEIALENLEKQKDEILEKLNELGIDPKNLDSEIEKLRIEIDNDLKKAEELLSNE